MTTDAWGIDDGWEDTRHRWHHANPATIEALRDHLGPPGSGRPSRVVRPHEAAAAPGRCRLFLEDGTEVDVVDRLPEDLPIGLHDLRPADGGPATTLICSPGRAHLPPAAPTWGITVQVPTARSRRSWGIGDLADVRTLAEWVGEAGAGLLALSPLHAPTPVAPIAASPYSPSSRRWRSPLLIRIDEVPGGRDADVQALAAPARALLKDPLVDRDRCWAQQRAALELIWTRLPDHEVRRLDAWRVSQGPPLEGWSRFCALAERHGPTWRAWPDDLQRAGSAAVAGAARDLADRVGFHAWLQLLVEDQLEVVRHVGPRIVQDLAVGVDPDGADAWLWQDLLAFDFSIGAPPDEFQPDGQRWGLPPWIPARLRDHGYHPMADLLRASMVRGGGLRIDHVMGLERLFWVPEGGDPADGAYVRFPEQHLLEIAALESARRGALLIGEDLGTVEAGFREQLRRLGIHSTRVVWFEDDPPEVWPRQAIAALTTHDLPTLAGMLSGGDSPPAMRHRLERLVGPLAGRDLLDVSVEVHHRLGASRAGLAVATLEDAVGVLERPNQPGTASVTNWSRALPVAVDDLPHHDGARRTLGALSTARPD